MDSYNAVLVVASYCVAVIASYTAIYFGTRVFHLEGTKRRNWLLAGALCLGSGVWSMHFVGMSAYEMPEGMTMSFSAGLTAISWLPALVASGLALYVITLPSVSHAALGAAALIMGAGIFSMHYLGMYAMQMEPGIRYDATWVAISGAIAVGASGAALVICRRVREVPSQHAPWVKALAALIMGAAICGMHYSGMVGAEFPMGATGADSNRLQGDWMGVPTAVAASIFLLMAVYVAYSDLRERERARKRQAEAQRDAHHMAFYDAETGLGNRAHLEHRLLDRLRVDEDGSQAAPFILLYFEFEAVESGASVRWAQTLASVFPEAEEVVRYGTSSFMLIHAPLQVAVLKRKLASIKAALEDWHAVPVWGWGISQFPGSASNSRGLIQVSQKVREWVRPQASGDARLARSREAV